MSTPSRAPLRAVVGRRAPRCPLAVPVRITVLHPGNAYSIPGRSLDLCEGGIAVVPAGELRTGDPVGVEFLLPDLGLGLQAKAVVRHYGALRCGFEFQQLTRHQQALIREWTRLMQGGQPRPDATPETTPEASPPKLLRKLYLLKRLRKFQHVLWWAAAVLVLSSLLVWMYWEHEWQKLEDGLPRSGATTSQVILTSG